MSSPQPTTVSADRTGTLAGDQSLESIESFLLLAQECRNEAEEALAKGDLKNAIAALTRNVSFLDGLSSWTSESRAMRTFLERSSMISQLQSIQNEEHKTDTELPSRLGQFKLPGYPASGPLLQLPDHRRTAVTSIASFYIPSKERFH
ncbi:hypothetical protein BT96DRAFT_652351 [Gymnopus androsaceus JB14]|uniref:Uncharacterized protein n=1 Tax=Gymnopus androsaceus JB14 TaxID=1447944 RepID=A0A6A4GG64_9AGAR|nr:hypothetical protein BT96DRAFT_652351 [Gymnopus androsaceus JB14]